VQTLAPELLARTHYGLGSGVSVTTSCGIPIAHPLAQV
jgi:hypothetical protein